MRHLTDEQSAELAWYFSGPENEITGLVHDAQVEVLGFGSTDIRAELDESMCIRRGKIRRVLDEITPKQRMRLAVAYGLPGSIATDGHSVRSNRWISLVPLEHLDIAGLPDDNRPYAARVNEWLSSIANGDGGTPSLLAVEVKCSYALEDAEQAFAAASKALGYQPGSSHSDGPAVPLYMQAGARPKDVARLLGVHPATVRVAVRQGLLPSYRKGPRNVMIDMVALRHRHPEYWNVIRETEERNTALVVKEQPPKKRTGRPLKYKRVAPWSQFEPKQLEEIRKLAGVSEDMASRHYSGRIVSDAIVEKLGEALRVFRESK